MTLRSFEGVSPRVAASAYVDETALVIGDVVLGEDSSIWPMVVVRGDVHRVRIGDRSNVQDGSILHVSHANPEFGNPDGDPLTIGADVTIGHKAVVHACTVEDRVLVGIGAVILDGAVIRADTMLAAGCLVPPGRELDSGYLYKGSPAKPARPLTDRERDYLLYSARHYVHVKDRHKGGRL